MLLLFSIILLTLLINVSFGQRLNCLANETNRNCVLMGPTDWFFAFDGRNRYLDNQHALTWHSAFRPLAMRMMQFGLPAEKLSIIDGHRVSVLSAQVGQIALDKDLCVNMGQQVLFRNESAYANAPGIHGVFDAVDRQLRKCIRRNFQSIVAMFLYGFQPDNGAEQLLEKWRDRSTRSIQIYILYAAPDDVANNTYNRWQENGLIHGCHHIPTKSADFEQYSNTGGATLTNMTQFLFNCLCALSEDCHANLSDWHKQSTCHFSENRDGVEECNALYGGRILFQPRQKLRMSAVRCFQSAQACRSDEIQECISDCELKQWGPWSECAFIPDMQGSYFVRNRTENNASLGTFTATSCQKTAYRQCGTTSKATAPTPTIIIDEPPEDTSFQKTIFIIIGVSIGVLITAMVCIVSTHCLVKKRKAAILKIPNFMKQDQKRKLQYPDVKWKKWPKKVDPQWKPPLIPSKKSPKTSLPTLLPDSTKDMKKTASPTVKVKRRVKGSSKKFIGAKFEIPKSKSPAKQQDNTRYMEFEKIDTSEKLQSAKFKLPEKKQDEGRYMAFGGSIGSKKSAEK